MGQVKACPYKSRDMKGLTIIYYGDGKGKTTAALGLALRAVGRGKSVLMLQFIKGEVGDGKGVTWTTGEREFVKKISNSRSALKAAGFGTLDIRTVGEGFVGILGDKEPFLVHKAAALRGLAEAKRALASGEYDIVILDEIIRAINEKLLTVTHVKNLISKKPEKMHLVLTGHHCPPLLIRMADLVSEVKKVKHPYDKGILAQIGIDY